MPATVRKDHTLGRDAFRNGWPARHRDEVPRAVKVGARNPQSRATHRPPSREQPRVLRLAELRQRYAPKLRQGDIARLLGVARQRVSEWERGVASPSVEQLGRLIVGVHELPMDLAFDPRWFHEQRERMRARLIQCGIPRRHEADNRTLPKPHV